MAVDKKKTPPKTTTKPAPKARKVAIKDLSEKDLKETTGGEFIPISSNEN